MMFSKTAVCALAAAAFAWGQSPVLAEKPAALIKQAALDFEQKSPMLKDEQVAAYAARLGRRLGMAAGLDEATVKVVNSTEGRAQMFPGGFVYLDSGLILRAATERDLATTLAHLFAHLANPRPVTGFATIPILSCSRFGLGPRPAQAAEEEADRLALQYVQNAGYDTSVLDPEFDRIQARAKAALPQPAPEKRPTLGRAN